jgi:hypothetical protein
VTWQDGLTRDPGLRNNERFTDAQIHDTVTAPRLLTQRQPENGAPIEELVITTSVQENELTLRSFKLQTLQLRLERDRRFIGIANRLEGNWRVVSVWP